MTDDVPAETSIRKDGYPYLMNQINILKKRVTVLESMLPKSMKKRKRSKEYMRHNNRPATKHDMFSPLKEAIQENIDEFIDNINVESSDLLDKLYENGYIDENDRDGVLTRSTQKDQVRFLVACLRQRSQKNMEGFINILRQDRAYSHIASKIELAADAILNGGEHRIKCVVCLMCETVNIPEIVDYLWKKKVLKTEIWELGV